MKRLFQTFAATLVLSMFVGCGVKSYPTAPAGAAVDVGIASIHLRPQHPLPGEPWRAVLVIKSNDKNMAKDIGYLIRIPERNLEIGRGHIGKILPEDTLEISSDDVRLPPGKYQIEGRLYLPTTYPQSGNACRVLMTVTVGQ
jgi:hypothetical protein